MMRAERVILRFLFIIYIGFNFNAASSRNTHDILSRILSLRPYKPAIVILTNKASNNNNLLRSSNHHVVTGNGRLKVPNDTVNEASVKKYVNKLLRSVGDKNDPIVKETNTFFLRALRSRCNKLDKCAKKCEKRERKKKKQCNKSCKEVYDYLMVCHPPGGKKKPKPQKKNSCEQPQNSCETKKKKDSCEQSEDSCKTKKKKESCEQSEDSCEKKTKGKTMRPTWRM